MYVQSEVRLQPSAPAPPPKATLQKSPELSSHGAAAPPPPTPAANRKRVRPVSEDESLEGPASGREDDRGERGNLPVGGTGKIRKGPACGASEGNGSKCNPSEGNGSKGDGSKDNGSNGVNLSNGSPASKATGAGVALQSRVPHPSRRTDVLDGPVGVPPPPLLYTLHTTHYALHPAPHILHPTPYTLHPTPYRGAPLGLCIGPHGSPRVGGCFL